eukprot:967032-Pyramimonas_sp.AAC.1
MCRAFYLSDCLHALEEVLCALDRRAGGEKPGVSATWASTATGSRNVTVGGDSASTQSATQILSPGKTTSSTSTIQFLALRSVAFSATGVCRVGGADLPGLRR